MARLPTPGGDAGNWGEILNDFLRQEHNADGSLKRAADIAAKANQAATDAALAGKAATTITDALRTDVDAVTPTNPGHVIANGPNGPVSVLREVNVRAFGAVGNGIADDTAAFAASLAALPATNAGMAVLHLPGGRYRLSAALAVRGGIVLEGAGTQETFIETTAADAGIRVADGSIHNRYIVVRNLTLRTVGSTPTGIDARGMTRALFEDLVLQNFTAYGMRWGGDIPGYASVWTNDANRVEIAGSPVCMRFDGLEIATGVPLPNNISIDRCRLTPTNVAGSIGLDVHHGENLRVTGCDISYAPNATAVRLRTGGKVNYGLFLGNRFEDIGVTTGSHPIEIETNSKYHQFLGNAYSLAAQQPWVNDADPLANRTVVMDARSNRTDLGYTAGAWDIAQDVIFRRALAGYMASGDEMVVGRLIGEAFRRIGLSVNGSINYYHPTTGAGIANLNIRSVNTGVLQVGNGYLAVRGAASLPPASASYRDVIAVVQGGAGVADSLRWCRKRADDTYEWVTIL